MKTRKPQPAIRTEHDQPRHAREHLPAGSRSTASWEFFSLVAARWNAPLVVFFVSLLLVASGCGKRHEPLKTGAPPSSAQVRVQVTQTKSRPIAEEVVGTIRAKLRATLEAKLSGRIEAMPVLLGEPVKKGQLIARLDAAEIKARFEQAQAGLDQADRDWKRSAGLLEQKGVTQAEYEAVEARRRIAQGALAEARAMMSYVEIIAPFDGVVTKKRADVGDLAAPGKPLVDVEDPSALQIEADVPEAIASHVQRGAGLQVRLDALTNALTGRVTEIAPVADPLSRTFRVKLDLASAPGLMSGQFARLVVPTGENSSLRVPVSAVVQRGQLEIVFTVADQHAWLHLVKTGRHVGDEVEILSGLDSGDTVVVEGAALLTDGQPVNVR